MTDLEERVATLEAIAFGEDPRISPGDRMKALEMLTTLPGQGAPGSAAMLQLAGDVAMLSGEALDKELEGFMATGWQPPPPPPPGSEADVERRVEARTKKRMRSWLKDRRGVSVAEPDRVAAEAPPQPVTEPRAPVEDEAKQRRAKVIRLDNGQVLDFGAPMTSAQHAIAQSKLARQHERDRIREEKRKRHAFAQHIPKGMDPEVWDRSFR